MYRGETQSNVARAIRRPRPARAAIRSRHRRSVAVTAASLWLASPRTFGLAGLTGDHVVDPAGGGGGGGGAGGRITFPTAEPKEALPVPEPGTWATMLFGLGLIGWRIRRGRKAGAKKLPA